MKFHSLLLIITLVLITANCTFKESGQLFRFIDASKSGLTFRNDLEINDSLNAVTFEYIYNGSGAGVGDFNRDGRQDLFFAGNMLSSRLYLNDGDLKFTDVTEASGTMTDVWCTGVSVVDINLDGKLDIYIAVAGLVDPELRKNICFINKGNDENGIPQFENQASILGIDDDGYSTMGVFFDYDKDKDLDMYLLTNSMEGSQRNSIDNIMINGESPTTDRFYRNNGDGTFTNWSREAGILKEGYGLGVGLCDINQDNWIDIYCANDFISSDLLWINNQDGTFTDSAKYYFKHFTSNGMGMDIADYNNDAMLDVVVLDMMPATNLRQKLMFAFRNMDRFRRSIEAGYLPQFMRNTLQLNMGKFPDGQFHFSEIGYLAGMYQTDWSWAPLMVDFDNDGWKDLLITNGYRKDVTNLDYINEIIEERRFGSNKSNTPFLVQAMDNLKDVKLQNYIFRNKADLTFEDKSEDWGLDQPSFTNGTITADLDKDGDLDIVLNNIDQEVHLYENLLNERAEFRGYLDVQYDSAINESEKIGSKLWVFHGNGRQFFEYSPYRGYKSTISQDIHIGLGTSNQVDSLIVQWPDGSIQINREIEANSVYTLRKNPNNEIVGIYIEQFSKDIKRVEFADVTNSLDLNIRHQESNHNDFLRSPSLLRSLSKNGPSLSVGDIDNDGREDIIVGGDRNIKPTLLQQTEDHNFLNLEMQIDSSFEDMGTLLFDADNDDDLDLYLVSGGSQWSEGHDSYQDRLYFNEGDKGFLQRKGTLPEIRSSGSCVTAADYDQDGDLDLFVGGRLVPQKYPTSPQSYLLRNDQGIFINVSEKLNNDGLLGMVTAALWTDVNLDGKVDIMVVGEWMSITVLINNGEAFLDESERFGLKSTSGWWNSINGGDLDNDGDIDYVVGNYGLNSFYKASFEEPLEIYGKDFDLNGTYDPIITNYVEGEAYIVHTRNVITELIPGLQNRFSTFETYGSTPFHQSFSKKELEDALHLDCKMMQTIVLERNEEKGFIIHELPIEVQFSPVFGSLMLDLNNDNLLDIMLTGNSMADETFAGYYDASYGNVLINKGDFNWQVVPPSGSHFIADGDKKAFVRLMTGTQNLFLATENNGYLQAFTQKQDFDQNTFVPQSDDWFFSIKDKGLTRKVEMYHGSGFLSSSSRIINIPSSLTQIEVGNYKGETRMAELD